LDATADSKKRGDLEKVVCLLVGDIVVDKDGLVVSCELLVFLNLLNDFRKFVEFVELGSLESLWVKGANVIDLSQFSPQKLKFVENNSEDGIAVLLLLEDDLTIVLLHKFYYIIIEAYLIVL
jgi:hypothetical protein